MTGAFGAEGEARGTVVFEPPPICEIGVAVLVGCVEAGGVAPGAG